MLVATGASNQEIARALVISTNTVKVHLRNIFEKLGVQSRTEATMEAVRRGWVPVDAGVPVGAAPAGETPASSVPPVTLAGVRPQLQRPLSRWKQLYMVAAGVLVTFAVLLPVLWQSGRNASSVSPLTDAGRPHSEPQIRSQALRWRAGAALPEARSRLALVAGPDAVYAIGGEAADGVTGRNDAYAPDDNLWQPRRAKPIPVSNVAGAWLDGGIYVPGGVTTGGATTSAVEVYYPTTDAWTSAASLPEARAAYALAAFDGKLYLFGGYDGTRYRDEVFIYDRATDRWENGPPMPSPRAFFAAGVVDKTIYVVGGYDGVRELERVDALDLATGKWSSRAPLSQPRAGLGLASLGSRLYAIGGGRAAPVSYNEQYDVNAGAWSRIDSPVVGEWRSPGVAALGQNVYAVGGWSGDYLDANSAYEAILRLLLPFGSAGK